ncbi:MAG: hypothetical protein ACX93J_12995 [Flagellimonas marinaquae]
MDSFIFPVHFGDDLIGDGDKNRICQIRRPIHQIRRGIRQFCKNFSERLQLFAELLTRG